MTNEMPDEPIFTEPRYEEALYENAPFGICTLRANGRIENSNRAFKTLTLYSGSELRQRSLAGVFHPDDVRDYHTEVRKMARDPIKDSLYLCTRLLCKDGTSRWSEVWVNYIRGEDGIEGGIAFLVPLPHAPGYRLEEKNGSVSVRPQFDLVSTVLQNPKSSLGILGLFLVATRLIDMEHLKSLIELFK